MSDQSPPPWVGYVGVIVTAGTIAFGAISQWYALQQRVSILEIKDRYEHGQYQLPPEAK